MARPTPFPKIVYPYPVEDLEKKFSQLDKKKYVVRKELEKLGSLVRN